jgi:hypothetical protein
MTLGEIIKANDLPRRSRFYYAVRYLTRYAKHVLDKNGNPRKHSFWWHGRLKRTRQFFKGNPQSYGVHYDSEKREVKLSPVDLKCISDKYLIHVGIVKNRKFDNIKNILNHGVFGNPRKDTPTYISPMSNVAQPILGIFGTKQNITLLINKKSLAKLRRIYIDPELIFGATTKDIITGAGSAYVVFGGIPGSAIEGISFSVPSKKTTFTLRNRRQIELNLKVGNQSHK